MHAKGNAMNTRTLIAAALTLASLAATSTIAQAGSSADFGYFEQPQPHTSTLTRAEVQREAIAARQMGIVVDGDSTHVPAPIIQGQGKTRAQVLAEAVEARRLGLIAHGDGHIVPSDMQLEQVRLAGLRALPMTLASR
jgi:hypothetical protein